MNPSQIIHYLSTSLEESPIGDKENDTNKVMRILIAIEVLLRTDLLSADVYENFLDTKLNKLVSSKQTFSSEITIKAKKILLIIQRLKKYSEE